MVQFFTLDACRIIILIIQFGFNYFQCVIYKIRGMINYVYGSNRIMQNFRKNFIMQEVKILKEQNLIITLGGIVHIIYLKMHINVEIYL